MNKDSGLLKFFQERLPSCVELLRTLVEMESYTKDKPRVDALAAFLSGEFGARGAEAEILYEPEAGNLLKAVWRSHLPTKPALVLGHLDTVFPTGTIEKQPFRIEGGKVFGPGVFDMKSGIAVSLLACEAFQAGAADPGREVIFFFTSDEETGTAAGLPHLIKAAEACRAVFCLEPSLPGGGVKTSRKGVCSYVVRTRGVAAHAGIDYEKGASAILELCRLVSHLYGLNDPSRGITVNVGTIRGGTAVNVVPEAAEAEVDIRFSRAEDGSEIENRIRSLESSDPRCTIRISGGIDRPPLRRSEAVLDLYRMARRAAAAFDVDLREGATGGGSDGSYTAAKGIPTLDGLGCRGDGAHSGGEYIELSDLPLRAAILCRLLQLLD